MDDRPIRPSREQRRRDFRRVHAPVLVWAVAALLTGTMLVQRATKREFVGLASIGAYTVASPFREGKIDKILVRELDRVKPGDPVVRLDDGPVKARIQTATAEAGRLAAEVRAARVQLRSGAGPLGQDYAATLRRFRMDEEERRLQALATRVEVEGQQVELQALRVDAERAAQLFEAGLVSQAELDLARMTADTVAAQLTQNKELLSRTEEEQAEAARRRESFEATRPAGIEPALAPLEEAVRVAQGLLEELRVEQSNLVLRSPVEGEVTQILCRDGQGVPLGEPILTIVESVPREIRAYLPERAAGRLKENAVVAVERRGAPGKVAESVVLQVGSTVETKPAQLWRDPQVPEYGIEVAIAAVPALGLLPGEVVYVRGPVR